MPTHLPDHFDPWRFAATGGHLRGALPLARMPRLTSLLAASDGWVTVAVAGEVDARQVACLTGELETTVTLICQRCLGPLTAPLRVPFRLALARSEQQAARLPEEYDPLVAPETELAMAGWVEDELILALPLAPMHRDPRECESYGFIAPGAAPAESAKPFARLDGLLQDSHKGN